MLEVKPIERHKGGIARVKKHLWGCWLVAALLLMTVSRAHAEPVLSLLRVNTPDGGEIFGQDLVRLWQHKNRPTIQRLSMKTVRDSSEALSRINRGRGQFAIVDVESLLATREVFPDVVVVAVLWPTLLQGLTASTMVREITLKPSVDYLVIDADNYTFRLLKRHLEKTPELSNRVKKVPVEAWPQALNQLDKAVLLVSSAVPLSEVTKALEKRPDLRMVSFSQGFVDNLRLGAGWLMDDAIAALAYPRLTRPIEAPAHYRVLVSRADLPEPEVRKMLSALYDKQSAKELVNPLFRKLDPKHNKLFEKLVSFHPITAEMFRLNESAK